MGALEGGRLGVSVGAIEGTRLGASDGMWLSVLDGIKLGILDGKRLGEDTGDSVFIPVGCNEGASKVDVLGDWLCVLVGWTVRK